MDIENPDPNDAAAVAAKPSRHAFWAWDERLDAVISGIRNGADAENVALAEPVERSRWWILCFWVMIALLIITVGSILHLIKEPWPEGRVRDAMTVVGFIALMIGGLLLSFVLYLTLSFAEERQVARRLVDLLLNSIRSL